MHAMTQKSGWLVWLFGVTAVAWWTATPLAWSQTVKAVELVAEESAEPCDQADAPTDQATAVGPIDMEAWRNDYESKQKSLVEGLRADPDWQATHEQTGSILTAEGLPGRSLKNFCLNLDGNLLACIGAAASPTDEVAEIRVFSPEGKQLDTWKLDAAPQAVCVHSDGTIFVAGNGLLSKLSADGKVLATAKSPAMLEPKKGKDDAAKPKSIIERLIAVYSDSGVPDSRKREITGIAVTDRDVFVVCPMRKGFGYAVWRLNHDLRKPKMIYDGLRGCCGQMDIQAKDGEIWIPENSRHQVLRCDRNGKELATFGVSDRDDVTKFGGCCEPKNLRFDSDGFLLTAESGPPNVVKRFTPEGEFRGVVALADFDGGCVRTTIEISEDGSTLFMLDTTQDSIRVFVDRRDEPTHEQVATISAVPEGAEPTTLHTFCVDNEGNLLMACGGERIVYTRDEGGTKVDIVSETPEIRVIGPKGELIAAWTLDMTPQAINVGEDGTVFVGGEGRLVKLDGNGKILKTADAPQIAALPPLPTMPEEDVEEESEEAKAAKEAKIADLREKMKPAMEAFQEAAKEMRATQADGAVEPAMMEKYRKTMTVYSAIAMELRELSTSPKVLAMQKRATAMRKRAVTGIAVSGQDLFVACPAVAGYGYDVYRTDLDFGNAKKIVTGLSGCCGQMDIQADDGELFVAENSRGRVVRYDRDGNELASWGKKDRTDVEGFGSCCNPMNIRFGPGGIVYTSESNLGRIKRFTKDGRFLGVVGTAEIVPGCKHVPIGISGDGSRVYLLDITRSHIVVLDKRASDALVSAGGQ